MFLIAFEESFCETWSGIGHRDGTGYGEPDRKYNEIYGSRHCLGDSDGAGNVNGIGYD